MHEGQEDHEQPHEVSHTSGNSRAPGASASSVIPAKNVNQQKVTRVTVPGVRRVWGTKKDASTTVVLQTVRQLAKIDPEK